MTTHRTLIRRAITGRWLAGSVAGIAPIFVAARSEGWTVAEIAETTGLTRQAVYDACDRAEGALGAPVGTRLELRPSLGQLPALWHALDVLGERAPIERHEISTYTAGSVMRTQVGWVAEVGAGSTLRQLGAYATCPLAVIAVLGELAERRDRLYDTLGAHETLWPLAPLA